MISYLLCACLYLSHAVIPSSNHEQSKIQPDADNSAHNQAIPPADRPKRNFVVNHDGVVGAESAMESLKEKRHSDNTDVPTRVADALVQTHPMTEPHASSERK